MNVTKSYDKGRCGGVIDFMCPFNVTVMSSATNDLQTCYQSLTNARDTISINVIGLHSEQATRQRYMTYWFIV